MGRRDCSGGGGGEARGYYGEILPMPTQMDQRSEDADDGTTWEGGEVPDRLYSGDQLPDL